MSRLKRARALLRLRRISGVPWSTLLEVGLLARGRWHSLSRKDRARLVALARRSHGRPGKLSRHERAEALRLVAHVDLKGLAHDAKLLGRSLAGKDERRFSRTMRLVNHLRHGRS